MIFGPMVTKKRSKVRIKFWTPRSPPPTPELLTKDFPSATRSRVEILTEENLVRAKKCSQCSFQDFSSLSKENQISLVRTFLSDPGSESKMGRLGGWGWKNDPEGFGNLKPSTGHFDAGTLRSTRHAKQNTVGDCEAFRQVVDNVSETPTPTTCLKITAVHLQFVRQYAPHLYRRTFLASKLRRKGNPAIHLPFVLQYASHLYGSTPPICTAVLLEKYWGLGSPERFWSGAGTPQPHRNCRDVWLAACLHKDGPETKRVKQKGAPVSTAFQHVMHFFHFFGPSGQFLFSGQFFPIFGWKAKLSTPGHQRWLKQAFSVNDKWSSSSWQSAVRLGNLFSLGGPVARLLFGLSLGQGA